MKGDVEPLADHGVIYLRDTATGTQPVIPYEEVSICVSLSGDLE